MTYPSKALRSLPLQGSPRRALIWLIVLAFGVPAVIVVGTFGFAYARGAPLAPLLGAGAVAFGITFAVTLWIWNMMRNVAVTLDADALTVATGIASRRFPLPSLRAHGLRVVDLAEHKELRPILRTWGIGLPGLASGWFRLRNGAKALCILTGREHVTALGTDDGTSVLLSLADPKPLRDALSDSR